MASNVLRRAARAADVKKNGGLLMGFIFGAIGIGLIIGGITMGGTIAIFIDMPSLAIVTGVTVFFTFAHHSPKEAANALRNAFGKAPVPATEAQRSIRVLWTARSLASASGVIGSLIGFVNMLANMDDPKSIGPAMAVALLTLLYAVLIGEGLIGPLINRLRNRVEGDRIAESPIKVTTATIAAIPVTLLSFFVLLLSMH